MFPQKEDNDGSKYYLPQRLDLLTALVSISMFVSIVIALFWLASVCYRRASRRRMEGGDSQIESQIKNDMDYLGDEDTTESVPLDWRIERPDHLRSYRRTSHGDPRQPKQPIFSDRDEDKTISIDDAEKGKVSSRREREQPQTRPVLNVIWEKSQEKSPPEDQHKKPKKVLKIEERQLISSTPVIIRKPNVSGHGHVDEPMVVNLYYEPSKPGEFIEVSKRSSELVESHKATTENREGLVHVASSEMAPCITVTVTKTKTMVSEPTPGYLKKVVETRTRTKEMRRKPMMDRDKRKALLSHPAEAPSVETVIEFPASLNKSAHQLSGTETAILKSPNYSHGGSSIGSLTTPTFTTSSAPASVVVQPKTNTSEVQQNSHLKEETTQTSASTKV